MFLEFTIRAQDRGRVRMQKAVCAGRFFRVHNEGFLSLTFPKNRFICTLKVIFCILTFFKSI